MATDDTPAGLAAWLPEFLSDELRPKNIDEWVARTSNAIRVEVPELDQYPDLVQSLDEAIREHWLAFLGAFTQPKFHFRLVERGVQLAEEVASHQFPIGGENYSIMEVAKVLGAGLPDHAKKLPKVELPDWFVRVYANFDKEIKGNLCELGYHRTTDASDAKALLGRPLTDEKKTILDTARSMIAEHLI